MKLCALLLFSLLVGCQYTPAYYNQSAISEEQMAVIEVNEYSPWGSKAFTQITAVYTLSGEVLIGSDSPFKQDRWDSVKIEPGEYGVVVLCESGGVQAQPMIKLKAESSKRYLVECKQSYKKNALGMKVVDVMDVVVSEAGESKE